MWLRALLFILIAVLHLVGETEKELSWAGIHPTFAPSQVQHVAFWGAWLVAQRRPGMAQEGDPGEARGRVIPAAEMIFVRNPPPVWSIACYKN